MTGKNGARRVVVTGLGVVTPIGLNVPDFWASLKAGKCGVGALGGFPLEDLKILIAAQIKDFDPTRAAAPLQARQADLAGGSLFLVRGAGGRGGRRPVRARGSLR